jgi:tetratricopeptide (TPR) repeat protein
MGGCRTAAVAIVLLIGTPAVAGLYDGSQLTPSLITTAGIKPLNYEQLQDELGKLTAVADPKIRLGPGVAARAAVVKQRDELLSRGPANLDPIALSHLGALQWRLRDGDAALNTLRQATNRDPRNFWALSNLGSVHQSLGQLREALSNLEAARDVFPDPWPDGPKGAADWYRQAEGYQFRLVRSRLKETMGRPTGGRPVAATDVDDLFTGVIFVGPSGQFEAGKLADAERAKLPKDAVAIVQQLLLWFPEDARLLWLLGELYNADGNLEAALKMFDMCVYSRRFENPDLRQHRRVLQDAFGSQASAGDQISSESPAPVPSILPGTWQVYTVAIIFGALLLALGYWQASELLRRLRGRTIE